MKALANLLRPLPPVVITRQLFQIGGNRGVVAQHSSTFKTHVTSGGGGG